MPCATDGKDHSAGFWKIPYRTYDLAPQRPRLNLGAVGEPSRQVLLFWHRREPRTPTGFSIRGIDHSAGSRERTLSWPQVVLARYEYQVS